MAGVHRCGRHVQSAAFKSRRLSWIIWWAGSHQLKALAQNRGFLRKKKFHPRTAASACAREFQLPSQRPALQAADLSAGSHLIGRPCNIHPSIYLPTYLYTYLCYIQVNLHFLWWTLTHTSAFCSLFI